MLRRPTSILADYVSPAAAAGEFAAAGLRISVSTLYKLAAGGRIPSHKPPGMGLLFRRDDLLLWIEKHRREAGDSAASAEASTGRRVKPGTRPACPDGQQPVAYGLPSEELQRRAGIRSR